MDNFLYKIVMRIFEAGPLSTSYTKCCFSHSVMLGITFFILIGANPPRPLSLSHPSVSGYLYTLNTSRSLLPITYSACPHNNCFDFYFGGDIIIHASVVEMLSTLLRRVNSEGEWEVSLGNLLPARLVQPDLERGGWTHPQLA